MYRTQTTMIVVCVRGHLCKNGSSLAFSVISGGSCARVSNSNLDLTSIHLYFTYTGHVYLEQTAASWGIIQPKHVNTYVTNIQHVCAYNMCCCLSAVAVLHVMLHSPTKQAWGLRNPLGADMMLTGMLLLFVAAREALGPPADYSSDFQESSHRV